MKRVRVVLREAVTWLVFAGIVASAVAAEIPGAVAEWAVRIGAWLATAVAIIRRVTPVLPSERGILPRDD